MARPFNNYGPGLKITDRRVIPDFARDMLAGRDIVMLSDGSPTRTFCYVADAVTGYYKVLVSGRPASRTTSASRSRRSRWPSWRRRWSRPATELFGYEGNVVHGRSSEADYLVDNPSRRCPDIDKARAELGYEPAVALDEGSGAR